MPDDQQDIKAMETRRQELETRLRQLQQQQREVIEAAKTRGAKPGDQERRRQLSSEIEKVSDEFHDCGEQIAAYYAAQSQQKG